MNKIALFTGCFDPIHKQHLAIIESLTKLSHIDQVWILINSYSEEKSLSLPFSVRKEMVVTNFLQKSEKIKIYDWPVTFYTTDLIKELKKKDSQNDFYLVLGTDQANNLYQWERSEDLSELVKFIFVNRNDYPLDQSKLKKEMQWEMIDDDNKYISSNFNSSQIREGNNWNWLSQPTLQYIQQNCLYFYDILESKMSDKRFQHSLSVAKLATKIARFYRLKNLSKTFISGLLHDITKEFTNEEHIKIWLSSNQKTTDLKRQPQSIWHAWTGAIYLKHQFLFENQSILDAVYFHSTGRANMTDLEKIIFVADKVDPFKNKSNMKQAYQMLFTHEKKFDDIFKLVLAEFWKELESLKKIPTKSTIEAKNYYLAES